MEIYSALFLPLLRLEVRLYEPQITTIYAVTTSMHGTSTATDLHDTQQNMQSKQHFHCARVTVSPTPTPPRAPLQKLDFPNSSLRRSSSQSSPLGIGWQPSLHRTLEFSKPSWPIMPHTPLQHAAVPAHPADQGRGLRAHEEPLGQDARTRQLSRSVHACVNCLRMFPLHLFRTSFACVRGLFRSQGRAIL